MQIRTAWSEEKGYPAIFNCNCNLKRKVKTCESFYLTSKMLKNYMDGLQKKSQKLLASKLNNNMNVNCFVN